VARPACTEGSRPTWEKEEEGQERQKGQKIWKEGQKGKEEEVEFDPLCFIFSKCMSTKT
jgi:hypothetical protein